MQLLTTAAAGGAKLCTKCSAVTQATDYDGKWLSERRICGKPGKDRVFANQSTHTTHSKL